MPVDKRVEKAENEFATDRKIRGSYEGLWADVCDHILPERHIGYAPFTQTPGRDNRSRLYDGTAAWANSQHAAILQSFITPPTVPWLLLGPEDTRYERDPDVRQYYHALQDLVLNLFNRPSTRFASNMHEMYLEFGGIGWGSAYSTFDRGFRLVTRPINECYIREDSYGVVNHMTRWFKLTIAQAAHLYGLDKLPKEISKKLETSSTDEEEFVHAVMPSDTKANQFDSIHWHRNSKTIVHESRFFSFPWLTPRYSKAPGEIYGRGPGVNVIGDIKVLQIAVKEWATAQQMVNRPPWWIPGWGMNSPVNMKPGQAMYYSAALRGLKPEPLISGANPSSQIDFIERHREIIIKAYLLDAVRPLIDRGDKSPLKAAQVLGMRDEAMRLWGPFLERLRSEFLAPLVVDRLIPELKRQRLIPDPPRSIPTDTPLKVEFISTAALAQRRAEVDNMTGFLNLVLPTVELAPEGLHNFDADAHWRRSAWLYNIHPDILRHPAKVEELRQQHAQAEQAQALLGGAQMAGDAAQGIGKGAAVLRDAGIA